ncbi:hypothetical protein FIU89_02565 [Roseovarius sp. THAF27]|uniref:hypothetical protein n=1 Tax=Roseovarius sp. THAF27 TaxID=2587850 RepID=UPI001268F9DA|nr:hypothetical protein [Roseovarius sp. THAF27]QFT79479.1 hypothetical protein FIU89_02565 [Roseovarius sp. THAF27]
MSFIRPDAAASLSRWREVLIGAGVVALGAWWSVGFIGILSWVGYILLPVGAALTFIGLQRARFRRATGGPGIVQVDEGRVTYFGPLTGGTVDLAEMSRLTLEHATKPAHWGLHQPGQPALMIPTTAQGADTLFDAFTTLPGLRVQKMLAALSSQDRETVTVWSTYTNRLH